MPNVVKYSTTAENNAIKKGNMAIGVNSVDYGDGSGWYNTIDVPTGGYVVYVNKASNGPSIMVPPDDTALVGAARSFGASSSVTTAAGALNYFASQSDMMVVNKNYNNIVTSGLVLNLDASFVASYPVSGTSWYDISGSGNTGTLVNGPTFSTDAGGSIVFDGSDDYVNIPYAGNTSNSFTFTIVMKCNNMDSNTSLNRQTLFGLSQNGNAAFRQFDVEIWGNTGAGFRGNGGAVEGVNFFGYNWTLGVNANNINIYTITLNSTGHSIYVNGVLRNTISQTATADFNSIVLGTRLSGNLWNGACYFFSMYNRELTLTEIQQNYYGGPIVTSGLTFAVDAGNLVSFQNGSGSTFSLVGSYTGVLQNGVSYTTGGGGSWVFDGSDDRILLDSSITMGNGSTGWTISAWVKTTTNVTGLGQGTIISNQSGGPVYSQLCINSGKICYWVYKTSWVQYLGNSTINTGNWVNLVWRNNVSNTMTFFVNGVSDGTVSDSSIGGPTTNPLDSIGRYVGQNSFAGDIALIMIHRAALTQNEIIQNFNAHRNRFGL